MKVLLQSVMVSLLLTVTLLFTHQLDAAETLEVWQAQNQSPPASDIHKAQEWYSKGYTAQLAGNKQAAIQAFQEAAKAYKEAIRNNPVDASLWKSLGLVYWFLNQRDQAIVAFKEVVRLQPDDADTHDTLGDLQSSDLSVAIAEYREAVRLKPTEATYHFDLGWALDQKLDQDAAMAEFREAIRLKPDHADSHSHLGAILHDKGDLDGAISEYRRALSLGLDESYAPRIQKALEEALSAKQASQLSIENKKADTGASALMNTFAKRDYIAAIDQARAVMAAGQATAQTYCILGASLFELGKSKDADMYLRQTLAMDQSGAYGQTARLYFAKLRHQQYTESQTQGNANGLGLAAREFLKSPQRTIFKEDDDKAARNWANDVLNAVSDISGEWSDQNGKLFKTKVENTWRITKEEAGQYKISRTGPRSTDITIVYGMLSYADGMYSGTLNVTVGVSMAGSDMTWEQSIKVSLKLSDDFRSLSGTATYGTGRTKGYVGGMQEHFEKFLSPGTNDITLVRR